MRKVYATLISEEETEQEETQGEGNIPQPTPSPRAVALIDSYVLYKIEITSQDPYEITTYTSAFLPY